MSKEVHRSLRKIAKGGIIIFLGLFIGQILGFFTRIIVVRSLTPSEYGILSLVLIIVLLSFRISSLGLQAGIARYISFFKMRNDPKRILGTILSSIYIALISGIIFFGTIFLGAGLLSKIFNNPGIASPLRLYSFAIPFLLITAIFVSIYRGFERADIKVIFQDLFYKFIILIGMGLFALIGFSLYSAIYVYLASAILTCAALALYSRRKFFKFLRIHKPILVRQELLLFSLPLLVFIFSSQIISWSDVLMLGYFKDAAAVGIYNTALPLANYIPLFLTSSVFLYLPLATRLYSLKQYSALHRNYVVLTKWIFSATLPTFLILFLFPSAVLKFLYGGEYALAGSSLSILALGFMVHSFLGPNGQTLMVLGKSRFIMFSAIASAVINLILNLIFIPTIGMLGAAIASAAALACTNVLISIKLYALVKIHPFTKNYLKPCAVSVLSILVVYYFAVVFLKISFWMLPFLFIAFVLIYAFSLLLTKSFDREDIMLLLALEKKIGINLHFIKSILKKFI